MQDQVVSSPTTGLSEGERFLDTFVAPSKTFTDILRSSSWWLPFLFMAIVSVTFNVAVQKKVGFDQIAQQQIEKNKFAAERIDALPPDQKAIQYNAAAQRTKVIAYLSPIVILIFGAIVSLLWWATLNFGMGAQTKFWQIFSVWMYAGLPKSFIYILSTILLFANVGVDNFDLQNPLGTNPGYFITSPGLRAALSFFDVFGIWALILAVLGTAIVARKKPSQTAIAVVGWWLFGLLVTAGLAAAFS